jgi:glycosyltransferase involved in cell wall biosynthesis
LTFSICIATHGRPELLAATLEGIGLQTLPPAEVLVSDSSEGEASRREVESFSARHPRLSVRYLRSERRALPWHRWWAFSHSTGDIVLFLDDDVVLHAQALEVLRQTYDRLSEEGRSVEGIGFVTSWIGGGQQGRAQASAREKWLRIENTQPGSLTAGGLTTSLAGFAASGPEPVEVLWGGGMSYRRGVLERVGCLKNLVSLYEAGVGRGEDAVLSFYARKTGGLLYAVPGEWASTPHEVQGVTPYPKSGWKLGIAHTWGRAHTMRWMATAWEAYRRDWSRLVLLEVARAAASALVSPLDGDRWKRLGGACWGIGRSLVEWKRIPFDAYQ